MHLTQLGKADAPTPSATAPPTRTTAPGFRVRKALFRSIEATVEPIYRTPGLLEDCQPSIA